MDQTFFKQFLVSMCACVVFGGGSRGAPPSAVPPLRFFQQFWGRRSLLALQKFCTPIKLRSCVLLFSLPETGEGPSAIWCADPSECLKGGGWSGGGCVSPHQDRQNRQSRGVFYCRCLLSLQVGRLLETQRWRDDNKNKICFY